MRKVLVIEDDPLISRMYQRIFRFEGYDVDFAKTGKEGIKKAKKDIPGLIFLDVMLPEINGIEVLKLLKKGKKTKDIPVVMLTNLAGSQNLEKSLELGAVKYIVKSEHDPKDIVGIAAEFIK